VQAAERSIDDYPKRQFTVNRYVVYLCTPRTSETPNGPKIRVSGAFLVSGLIPSRARCSRAWSARNFAARLSSPFLGNTCGRSMDSPFLFLYRLYLYIYGYISSIHIKHTYQAYMDRMAREQRKQQGLTSKAIILIPHVPSFQVPRDTVQDGAFQFFSCARALSKPRELLGRTKEGET
jgi:hypothetical protein